MRRGLLRVDDPDRRAYLHRRFGPDASSSMELQSTHPEGQPTGATPTTTTTEHEAEAPVTPAPSAAGTPAQSPALPIPRRNTAAATEADNESGTDPEYVMTLPNVPSSRPTVVVSQVSEVDAGTQVSPDSTPTDGLTAMPEIG